MNNSTSIINQSRINMVAEYDAIADVYDRLFVDPKSISENKYVSKMLECLKGSVFEIGCGTGLLYDLISNPTKYLGCDPSKKMIDIFLCRHEELSNSVRCCSFEDCQDYNDYNNIVSIFGSISYVKPEKILELSKSMSKKFLMFYKDDYTPITYIKTNTCFSHNKYSKKELETIFQDCEVKKYHNYFIVTNIKN